MGVLKLIFVLREKKLVFSELAPGSKVIKVGNYGLKTEN